MSALRYRRVGLKETNGHGEVRLTSMLLRRAAPLCITRVAEARMAAMVNFMSGCVKVARLRDDEAVVRCPAECRKSSQLVLILVREYEVYATSQTVGFGALAAGCRPVRSNLPALQHGTRYCQPRMKHGLIGKHRYRALFRRGPCYCIDFLASVILHGTQFSHYRPVPYRRSRS